MGIAPIVSIETSGSCVRSVSTVVPLAVCVAGTAGEWPFLALRFSIWPLGSCPGYCVQIREPAKKVIIQLVVEDEGPTWGDWEGSLS